MSTFRKVNKFNLNVLHHQTHYLINLATSLEYLSAVLEGIFKAAGRNRSSRFSGFSLLRLYDAIISRCVYPRLMGDDDAWWFFRICFGSCRSFSLRLSCTTTPPSIPLGRAATLLLMPLRLGLY